MYCLRPDLVTLSNPGTPRSGIGVQCMWGLGVPEIPDNIPLHQSYHTRGHRAGKKVSQISPIVPVDGTKSGELFL
jgi:hypothetical protein